MDGILGAVDQLFGVVGIVGEDDARTRFDVKGGEQQGMAVRIHWIVELEQRAREVVCRQTPDVTNVALETR